MSTSDVEAKRKLTFYSSFPWNPDAGSKALGGPVIAEAVSACRAAWRVSCFPRESCPPLHRLRTSPRRTSKFAGFVLPSFPPALGFEHLGQKNAAFSGSSLTVSQVTSI